MRARQRSVLAAAILAAVLLPAALAERGGNGRAGAREMFFRALSGLSPFPGPCGENSPLFVRNSAVEPTVAVNPRNPRNIVAAWIQDDGSTILVAASRDGGRAWARVLVPGLTVCTGGTFPASADPWISFGADGKAYLAVGLGAFTPGGVVTAQAVARSVDGGFSWSLPAFPQPQTGARWDKQLVAADPRRRGRAYSVFAKRTGPTSAGGALYLARTADGGATWSAPREIFDSGAEAWPEPGGSLVLRDGTLLEAVLLARQDGRPVGVIALRSRDQGRTWSRTTIATAGGRFPADPRSGDIVEVAPALPSLAVAPDRTVYAAWADLDSPTRSRVLVARSSDGGRSWKRMPPVSTAHGQTYLVTVAVARDGTVGVTYYRSREASLSDGTWPTEVRFAASVDRGRHWRTQRLRRSFDIGTGERPGGGEGLRIADYCGLAGLQHGFAAVFVMTKPPARNRPQNVFFVRLENR